MIDTIEKIYADGEWSSYKMTLTNGKIWSVPLVADNTDYQAIQEWIADGGTVIDNGGGE
tara:strand:+ start:544 stop:720 length:177 start_codon:yes stop_codon:yes gene_type:complete